LVDNYGIRDGWGNNEINTRINPEKFGAIIATIKLPRVGSKHSPPSSGECQAGYALPFLWGDNAIISDNLKIII
jgi:hypothetical protein